MPKYIKTGSPKEKGRKAFLEGRPITDNPYEDNHASRVTSPAWHRWNVGWLDAQEEQGV